MMISFVLSAVSLGLCIVCFFFCRWYIQRKTAARELLADYREEVYRLIAEIDAATDRDSLLVEERIKTLKKIIEDTDRRISVYIRELQRSRNGEVMYTSLGRGIRAALDSARFSEQPPADAPHNITEPIQETPPAVSPPPPGVDETGSADEKHAEGKRKNKKNRLKAQVAEISAQGLSPHEIAARLDMSIAEVDLALNLLKQPNKSTGT